MNVPLFFLCVILISGHALSADSGRPSEESPSFFATMAGLLGIGSSENHGIETAHTRTSVAAASGAGSSSSEPSGLGIITECMSRLLPVASGRSRLDSRARDETMRHIGDLTPELTGIGKRELNALKDLLRTISTDRVEPSTPDKQLEDGQTYIRVFRNLFEKKIKAPYNDGTIQSAIFRELETPYSPYSFVEGMSPKAFVGACIVKLRETEEEYFRIVPPSPRDSITSRLSEPELPYSSLEDLYSRNLPPETDLTSDYRPYSCYAYNPDNHVSRSAALLGFSTRHSPQTPSMVTLPEFQISQSLHWMLRGAQNLYLSRIGFFQDGNPLRELMKICEYLYPRFFLEEEFFITNKAHVVDNLFSLDLKNVMWSLACYVVGEFNAASVSYVNELKSFVEFVLPGYSLDEMYEFRVDESNDVPERDKGIIMRLLGLVQDKRFEDFKKEVERYETKEVSRLVTRILCETNRLLLNIASLRALHQFTKDNLGLVPGPTSRKVDLRRSSSSAPRRAAELAADAYVSATAAGESRSAESSFCKSLTAVQQVISMCASVPSSHPAKPNIRGEKLMEVIAPRKETPEEKARRIKIEEELLAEDEKAEEVTKKTKNKKPKPQRNKSLPMAAAAAVGVSSSPKKQNPRAGNQSNNRAAEKPLTPEGPATAKPNSNRRTKPTTNSDTERGLRALLREKDALHAEQQKQEQAKIKSAQKEAERIAREAFEAAESIRIRAEEEKIAALAAAEEYLRLAQEQAAQQKSEREERERLARLNAEEEAIQKAKEQAAMNEQIKKAKAEADLTKFVLRAKAKEEKKKLLEAKQERERAARVAAEELARKAEQEKAAKLAAENLERKAEQERIAAETTAEALRLAQEALEKIKKEKEDKERETREEIEKLVKEKDAAMELARSLALEASSRASLAQTPTSPLVHSVLPGVEVPAALATHAVTISPTEFLLHISPGYYIRTFPSVELGICVVLAELQMVDKRFSTPIRESSRSIAVNDSVFSLHWSDVLGWILPVKHLVEHMEGYTCIKPAHSAPLYPSTQVYQGSAHPAHPHPTAFAYNPGYGAPAPVMAPAYNPGYGFPGMPPGYNPEYAGSVPAYYPFAYGSGIG